MNNNTLLSEKTLRDRGRQAQQNNILAGRLIAETVRTTLGPKGMDKLLVDQQGNITVTNDGVTILQEMNIQHPAARMIFEVAQTQEEEIGDGTTTAVIIAGELLKNAEQLLEDNIHPTTIIAGYQQAEAHAQKTISEIAQPITPNDKQLLTQVAQTAMTGKGAESAKQHLAKLIVQAINTTNPQEPQAIQLHKQPGAPSSQSRLINGLIIDKNKCHPNMPDEVQQAKILLLDTPLELKQTDLTAQVSVTDPAQIQAFIDQESQNLHAITKQVTDTGANVVFCQKGIDDLIAYQLAKQGILAVRRVPQSTLTRIAHATKATITSELSQARDVLGSAGNVKKQQVGDEDTIFIQETPTNRTATILVRAATSHVTDEVLRAVSDAVGDVRAALKNELALGGAGACEMRLYQSLSQLAKKNAGREQLAIEAYARSLLVVPRTLAENAGLDQIDVLTDLKSSKVRWPGITLADGLVADSWEQGIIEPASIKQHALSAATQVATMILRIDDVILAEQETSSQARSPADEL